MVNDNPGYAYAYGWNRFNMGVIGVWPEDNQNFIVKNLAFVYSFIVVVLIWLPMTASLPYLGDDISELIECIVIDVVVAVSVFKIILFRLRREVLVAILTAMSKDWSVKRSKEEKKSMLEKAKYARYISIMSVSLACCMFIAFGSFGALTARIARQSVINETNLAIGFPYPSWFPFDTKDLSIYLPMWFGQLLGTVFSMVGYSGPDSSMAMMILHLCGQLATVRLALINIVDEECIKDPNVYWSRLSSIIERHEELNRCGELLEGSFNGMLLIQMVLCSITFCFQGFGIITTLINGLTSDEDFPFLQLIFFIIHIIFTILHLFVYCWTGDLLVVESTALSHAPYESDWFLLQPDQAKALMMITNRSRIPLEITAGKFVGFSLELFTNIMKTSMGYLSVLMAMQDE